MAHLLIALATCVAGTAPVDEYCFEPDTSRWVEMEHVSTFDIGRLDEAGTFHPHPGWLGCRKHGFKSGPARWPLNIRFGESVYEFRSGTLIEGRIDGTGEFVPDLDGKIIAFKDYHYSPKAKRIYNLPGRFMKIEKVEN